jgi:hypothetical protein
MGDRFWFRLVTVSGNVVDVIVYDSGTLPDPDVAVRMSAADFLDFQRFRAAVPEVAQPAQATNSAMDAIRLCADLVKWHDARNLSFGEPYHELISRARCIAERHHG